MSLKVGIDTLGISGIDGDTGIEGAEVLPCPKALQSAAKTEIAVIILQACKMFLHNFETMFKFADCFCQTILFLFKTLLLVVFAF